MGSKVGLCTVRFLTTKFMHICMQTVRCPGPDLQQKCVLLFLQSGGSHQPAVIFLCNSCFTEDSLECRSFHIFLFQKGKGWRRSIPIEGLYRAGRVNVSPGRLIFLLQFNWHLHYANLHGCWNGCKYYCLFSPISFNVLDRWFHQQH